MNTKFKTATAFRTSLETRLKALARSSGEDLQRLRTRVAFDRFLARIFVNGNNSFILKGGYAMELRYASARTTKDIDLTCLSRAHSNIDSIDAIILDQIQGLVQQDLQDFFSYR